MSSHPIVFLVDDDPDVRDSLRCLMRSVGQALETYATAQEFLEVYEPSRPGCLLLDVRMPGMSGLDLVERLKELGSHLPIIIITGHADVPMAVRAMKTGVLDFLQKPFNDQVLLDRIRVAFEENARVRRLEAHRAEVLKRLATLTPRERQVLDAIVHGKANNEIAQRLKISLKTLSIHRGHILDKMEAQSVADLVRMVVLLKMPED